MVTVNALATIAPDINGFTAANAVNGIGLHLTIDKDLTKGIVLTELWASTTNNRSVATKQDVIIGRYYFYPGKPNAQYYFWVRNMNSVGNPNGNWFPSSATAGVSGKVLEISGNPNCDVTDTFTGDNTYQLIGEITVDNPTAGNSLINILFQAWQEYSADANTNWEVRYLTADAGTTPSGSETVWKTYPVMTTRQNNISIALQKFSVLANKARTFRFYWKGATTSVSVSFPQIFESHDYNNPSV